MKNSFKLSVFVIATLSLLAIAAEPVATLRGEVAIANEAQPERVPIVENDDVKRKRSYPMQPPTIPHKIDNYQVDLRSNKCMSCHGRRRTEESQAPMVSVTHFMDRDGNFLAEVSPRRYFCGQCHVVQTEVRVPVVNEFKDIDEILSASSAK